MSDTELLPKSEPVRRLEVFTGAGRRRAWSAEQKARIVAESCESGTTVCAVARRHGLTPQQLFAWRRLARRGAAESAGTTELTFAPVVVAPAGKRARMSWPSTGTMAPGTLAIEVVIGATTVRVPAGADATTLQTVLRAVKAAS
jgi:transposase